MQILWKNPTFKTLTMVRIYKEMDEISCHTFWWKVFYLEKEKFVKLKD
jgi:hypothetical protein